MNTDTLRNWLNLLFMIGAVVGLIFYFTVSKDTGIYIILIAMAVKFSEATLRMLKI